MTLFVIDYFDLLGYANIPNITYNIYPNNCSDSDITYILLKGKKYYYLVDNQKEFLHYLKQNRISNGMVSEQRNDTN